MNGTVTAEMIRALHGVGTCQGCYQRIALRGDGRLSDHRERGGQFCCTGSSLWPREIEQKRWVTHASVSVSAVGAVVSTGDIRTHPLEDCPVCQEIGDWANCEDSLEWIDAHEALRDLRESVALQADHEYVVESNGLCWVAKCDCGWRRRSATQAGAERAAVAHVEAA